MALYIYWWWWSSHFKHVIKGLRYWYGSIRRQCFMIIKLSYLIEPCQYHMQLIWTPFLLFSDLQYIKGCFSASFICMLVSILSSWLDAAETLCELKDQWECVVPVIEAFSYADMSQDLHPPSYLVQQCEEYFYFWGDHILWNLFLCVPIVMINFLEWNKKWIWYGR